MGISSYKEAERYRMRTNKNLTRSFYLDTRRTLDEEPFAWEQTQDAGIMQPEAVQEFSEGGVVERQGYMAGQGVYERKNYAKEGVYKVSIPEKLQKKLDIAKLEINKRNDLGILSRAEDIGKISGIDKNQINVYIRRGLLPSFITKEEAVIKYFNNAIENNSSLNNFRTKNILDYLNHEMPLGSKGRIGSASLLDIINKKEPDLYNTIFSQKGGTQNLLSQNPRVKDIAIKDYLKDPNLIKSEQAILSSSIGAKRDELRILEGKLKLGPKDFAISQAQDIYVKELNENIRKQVKEIGYDEWVKRNPDLIEYAGLRFDNKTNQFVQRSSQELQKYIDDGFFSIDHKNKKSGGKINIEYPTNKQIVPAGINSGYIRSTQTYLKNNIDKYGKDLNTTRIINDIVDKAKKFDFTIGMDEVPNYQGSTLAKNFKGVKNIGGTQYSTVNENVLTGFDEQLKKFNLDTSTVSKNVTPITQEEFLKTKEVMKGRTQNLKDIINITPQEEIAVKNVLNRVNLGVDPTQMSELAQQLYSKEINTVKNLIDKIPKPVKTAAKFVTFGDVALETIMALPRLASGDIEGAKRESIAGLFGYGKSLEEELLEVSKNPKSLDRALKNLTYIPELKGLVEDKKNTEEALKKGGNEFEPVLIQNLDRINSRIEELQDYVNKNPYLEEDRDELLKTIPMLAKKITDRNIASKLNIKPAQGITPLQRLGFKDAQQKIGYGIAEELNLFEKMDEKDLEKALGKKIKIGEPLTELPQDFETPVVETPIETQNETPAVKIPFIGNERVELKKGGISRRDVLALLTGAAAAPELIKTIKGTKKAAQTVRTASKIKIEPAEGMYPWFPKLVEKVKEMGKPFEEERLIMEPSYKNSPRPLFSTVPKGEEKLTKHVDGDTTFILREYPDGRIAVDINSPRNQQSYGQAVSLYYRPKMEFKNYKGEIKVEPAEFKVLEPEPRNFVTSPDDVDIMFTEIPKNPKRDIVFADIEAAERFATGKIKDRKIIPVKQSLRNEMEDDPSTFIARRSGELGSASAPEEVIKSSGDILKLPE